MPRLTRKNIKVFAGNATNNGVFGSLQANNPTTTNDIEQLQSLSAWGEGWNAATETSEELPPLEEIQSVSYVTTYQQAYLMQEGLPEWAATVTYYKGSLTKEVTATGFKIYSSLTDNNTGNLLSDTSNWKKVMDSDEGYAFPSDVTTAISTLLSTLYPVGACYMGTQTTCPLSSLMPGTTWTLVSSGKALWTGTGSNANTTINAGLPNITGTFGARDGFTSQGGRDVNFNVASGSFYLDSSNQSYGTWDSTRTVNGGKSVSFNASRSSSIYGGSSTVQPPAYVVNVWRRTA